MRAEEPAAGLVMRELRAASAFVVGLPGPAAPLPVRKDEFEGAADHGDRGRAPVDERECLCCRLRGDHRGEHGIARGGIRAGMTGELGEDERPGGVAFGAGQVQAAQAGRAPGQDKRANYSDGFARGGGQVGYLVPGQGGRQVTAVAVGKDDQARPPRPGARGR